MLLLLDLFSGMDGLGHAIGAQIEPHLESRVLVYLFETDTRCRKLLRQHRVRKGVILSSAPDSKGLVGSVLWLVEGGLQALLLAHPSILSILITGGSPCVGFSAAKVNGKGIDDSESRKMWVMPVIITQARNLLASRGRGSFVAFILENVRMKPACEQAVSRTMGVPALPIDAGLVCACARPRLFWTNLVTEPPAARVIDPSSVLDAGWRPLWELASSASTASTSSRFSTFLRPFSAGFPYEFPASYPRLPLSSYSLRGLVYKADSTNSELEIIHSWIKSSINIDTNSIKEKGSPSQVARGLLCDWIHQQGGSRILRPLRAHERDLALGFPAGASSLADEDSSDGFGWPCQLATGNSFAVPVLAHVAQPVVDSVLSGNDFVVLPGFPSVLTEDEALISLGSQTTSSGNIPR